ncbi:Crp/Fnr family transcriptional regulator [Xylophilus sp. ASV27]|uniref:Crp/Fnr family transcriptional regulator n=1 Tax=Xylophilus sp. ASV27 TaxID=2795129 RepID=UPI0018EC21A1|nr:cyclic nucleotide-binding domain-containing protein [Xylophilus sp. ASV27]
MQGIIPATNGASGALLQGLVDAIALAQGEDVLIDKLSRAQWQTLAPYLQYCHLAQGQTLFAEGSDDRTLYFVEQGTLSVHAQDQAGRLRLAMVGAGSLLGEGAFFSHQPRRATAQAGSACRLWSLSPVRFTELTHRQPEIAIGLLLAAGAVLARRLANRRRRVAVA